MANLQETFLYFQKFSDFSIDELFQKLEIFKPGHRGRVERIIQNFWKHESYIDLLLLNQYMDLGEAFFINYMSKKTPFSKEEKWELERHPILSGHVINDLVRKKELGTNIFEAVLYHHERWDGKGIFRVKGKDIPFIVRLIGPIDFYVGLTSERPSRKAMTHEEAVGYLILQGGKMFDPGIIQEAVWAINTSPPSCLRSKSL